MLNKNVTGVNLLSSTNKVEGDTFLIFELKIAMKENFYRTTRSYKNEQRGSIPQPRRRRGAAAHTYSIATITFNGTW